MGLLIMLGVASCQQPDIVHECRSDWFDPRNTEAPGSRYVTVRGAQMHYVECGTGRPVVFVHGQPTSTFLWRNIAPRVAAAGARTITMDLIGFGRSERPDIAYTAEEHTAYFVAFIEALDLDDMVLVLHDWGSYLGFQYAKQHPDRVRGLVFMESILPPGRFEYPDEHVLTPRAQEALEQLLKLADAPEEEAERLNREENVFLDQILPLNVVRELQDDERAAYHFPFADSLQRRPMMQWPRQIPRRYTTREILAYSDWLSTSDIPKLMFTVEPGFVAPQQSVDWARDHLSELEIVHLGPGLHFVQEDYPGEIGRRLAAWLKTLDAEESP